MMRFRLSRLCLVAALLGCDAPPATPARPDAAPIATGAVAEPDPGDGSTAAQVVDGGDVTDDVEAADEGNGEYDVVRPPKVLKPVVEVPHPDLPRPTPGQGVAIPGGTLVRGSAVDDLLRDQFAENDHIPTAMTPFEIDALPYPNDPGRPYLTGVTQAEAEARCAEQGKRLCTELEWEWACRGEDARRYPGGNRYLPGDYPDEDPVLPASPFGVFAQGRLLEWTASRWGQDPDQVERVTLRGYSPEALTAGLAVTAEQGRRCAKRWHTQPEIAQPDLGFRCCRGAVNKATCFLERPRPAHSLYNNMKPDKFARVIRDTPELSMIHDNPHMFSDADVRAVLARRGSDRKALAKEGVHFRWKPMRWIPRQGMELWVAVGRSDRHSFVVALHEVEDNEKYVHASSLILWNQPVPLALAYREGHRDQVFWAPCWGCRDGGTIEFDDAKNEVIITHKW